MVYVVRSTTNHSKWIYFYRIHIYQDNLGANMEEKSPCFACESATKTTYYATHVARKCLICGWEGYIVKIPEVIR